MTNPYTTELMKSLEIHKIEMRNAKASRISRWSAMAFLPFAKSSEPKVHKLCHLKVKKIN